MPFRDHFSEHADEYAQHRPTYPQAMFDYLASLAPSKELAWDCGTGNGQAALALAENFQRVIATDASAAQIEKAFPHERVEYRVEPSENTTIPAGTVDLITVGTAVHWFNFDAFYAEVRRVAKREAILAVWTYYFPVIDPAVDQWLDRFYWGTLKGFWPERIRYLEERYQTLPFPFDEIHPPAFEMEAVWTVNHFIGFISSWSGVRKLVASQGEAPFEIASQRVETGVGAGNGEKEDPLAIALPGRQDRVTLTNPAIAQLRLLNQRISAPTFTDPGEVVDWLGAVQAQDYFGAKWALGLRMRDATDNAIDQAFNAGSILRTHLLRPTWHFVRPADIRWMLMLTAPRVHAASASMYRKMGLDNATFKRSDAVLAKALTGGKHLTRDELRGILENADIATENGVRMSYLMMHAELEGILCSGPRRGKQFTYALLDERAPHARKLEREEALAELARRFFTSRGPASAQDFAKWSGLTVADAREGLDAIKANFEQDTQDTQTYWFLKPRAPAMGSSPTASLLSVYDEYISSYKDRSAIDAGNLAELFRTMGNALQYIILLDGQFAGTWKRTIKKDAVFIEANLFTELTEADNQAVSAAAQHYADFLGKELELHL